jgi:hypothetical protein
MTVKLSRANLTILLSSLDAGISCTIIKPDGTMVTTEPDALFPLSAFLDTALGEPHMQTLELSKRNLLTLLHKLTLRDSKRSLVKPGPNGPTLVTAVSDAEAYKDRAPGQMHPETEEFIRRAEQALKIAEPGDQNPPAWAIRAAAAVNKNYTDFPDSEIIAQCFREEYGL